MKRYRTPAAKPGEVKIVYGKADRYDAPDLCAVWGGQGADKCDARMVMTAMTEKRRGYSLTKMAAEERPSLVEELEARGYDITTLKFSIQRKPTPNESSPHHG
ncbi:hypothetical protein HNO88_000297 [Novosphingobium chloroacetimidivorans]|uniref:Uncharacterized protein n=1 Tax=Novosphingobium chloroacetimidivorans TaxID=1428314 RepID=A0A7W7NVC8_9SPHN|nr:hypothetical protein [Novosphingobium chloroacetimidivorans]MBB4857000.1 hypothetical protein [Novosphingobium chloroacetimidivorans]